MSFGKGKIILWDMKVQLTKSLQKCTRVSGPIRVRVCVCTDIYIHLGEGGGNSKSSTPYTNVTF